MQEQPPQQSRNLLIFFALCCLLFAGWVALRQYLWPPPPEPPATKKEEGPAAEKPPLPAEARPPVYVSTRLSAAAQPNPASVAVYGGLAFLQAEQAERAAEQRKEAEARAATKPRAPEPGHRHATPADKLVTLPFGAAAGDPRFHLLARFDPRGAGVR